MCNLGGVFRRSFLEDNHIYFRDGMIAQEDTLFYFELSCFRPIIRKTNSVCYMYRQRKDSITHSNSEQRSQKYYFSMRIMLDVYLKYLEEKKFVDLTQLQDRIHHSKENVVTSLCMCSETSFVKRELKKLKIDGIYPYALRSEILHSWRPTGRKVLNSILNTMVFLMPIEPFFWVNHIGFKIINRFKNA